MLVEAAARQKLEMLRGGRGDRPDAEQRRSRGSLIVRSISMASVMSSAASACVAAGSIGGASQAAQSSAETGTGTTPGWEGGAASLRTTGGGLAKHTSPDRMGKMAIGLI